MNGSIDTDHDDAARIRYLQQGADGQASRYRPPSTGGARCVVGQILTSAGPAAPGFFKAEAYDLTGAEVEGGAGTLTDATYSFICMNLGSAVPGAGTALIFTFVDYRWVFRYDG